MATIKGVRIWAMVALMGYMLCACGYRDTSNSVVKKIVYHDTIYKDSFIVEKLKTDTVYFDSKWLRKLFETAKWEKWRNYKDSIAVEYPEFMKYMPDSWERKLHVEYHGISMLAVAYDDESDMPVLEKYEAVNMGAVTKSVSQNSFLLAGSVGDRKLFFEKDIKLKKKKWLYLRVEFPSELTWAIDPLLQYVLDYQVSFLLFAGDS